MDPAPTTARPPLPTSVPACAEHERLRLTELHAGYDRERNIVNFNGKLVRHSDNLTARLAHDFKGAADCVSGTTVVYQQRQ